MNILGIFLSIIKVLLILAIIRGCLTCVDNSFEYLYYYHLDLLLDLSFLI